MSRSVGARRLKRVLEGAVDAAVILDQEHRVLYRNPAYDAYTGRAAARGGRAGAGGHAVPRAVQPRDLPAEDCLMRRAVAAGKPLRMHEIHARRGDGEELTLIVTSTPLGERARARDLPRRHRRVARAAQVSRAARARARRQGGARAEGLERTEELRRAQDQLVLNEKMSSLGRLVAGIAHELNNPINFVYGNVDFLASTSAT